MARMEPVATSHTVSAQGGFTLSAVVVSVVALASVAAMAVPNLTMTGRDARVESVEGLASVVKRTSQSVHTACLVDPRCNVRNASQFILLQGQYQRVNHGWLDAAHAMANGEIDAWVHHNGFRASMPDATHARFDLLDAPEPARCGVTYFDAQQRGTKAGVVVSTSTAGC